MSLQEDLRGGEGSLLGAGLKWKPGGKTQMVKVEDPRTLTVL